MHILIFFLFEHCHLTSLLDILCLTHVCFFRPVQGLIFLFKWKADDEPQGSVVHDTRRQSIFFAKQVSDISEEHFRPYRDIDLPLVCSQACANIRMIRKYLAMYVTDGIEWTKHVYMNMYVTDAVKVLNGQNISI